MHMKRMGNNIARKMRMGHQSAGTGRKGNMGRN